MESHSSSVRDEAVALLRRGVSNRLVAETLGVPRGTVGWWNHEDRRLRGVVFERPSDCPRCKDLAFDRTVYAYLLGLYLGDGHIVSKPRQHHLSVYCSEAWPGLIDAAEQAMRALMAVPRTSRLRKRGCVEVKSYSPHWVCMFPQHGPGKKHDRRIVLEKWQQDIITEHPWDLIRGLVHSDGCRVVNWTERVVNGRLKRYEYSRYLFTNKSDDIRGIYTDALTSVGVDWSTVARGSDPFHVSVARRASVALMDRHVGPKF